MERLTAFNGGIWGLSMKAVADGYDRYSAFSKLAAYENTELTPEDIKSYLEAFKRLSHISVEKDLEITRITKLCDYWEREAKKYCARLGEIRILAESN